MLRSLIPFSLLLCTALPLLGVSLTAEIDDPAFWRDGWARIAEPVGDGFVVWESNRTGQWRIFRRDLAGTEPPTQLTPEDGREHFAPHLSPDGSRMVYAVMPAGKALYKLEHGYTGELHLIHTDGSNDRILVPRARAYYEDRVALWIDDDSLYFIDGEGTTQRLTISTGETVVRAYWPGEPWGWLPNRQETHITAGWPMFPLFNPETGRILYRRNMPGCQPYFSFDGVWGFWTGGAGGPLNRFELATRRESPILTRHDSRLPEFRRYLYFPMLSVCQTRFAFGASFYEHDHFASDYDVFVAAIDPFTLELEGEPQRYTFDRGCDRFPDVHFTPLRLGKQRGMVPVSFEVPPLEGDGWTIDFGDGTVGDARTHTYREPGSYWVSASRGDDVRRGRVRVDALVGPRALDARLIESTKIAIDFDAAIELRDPRIRLDTDSAKALGATLGETAQQLIVQLDHALRASTTVTIDGVVGADAPQLPVVATDVPVRMRSWPVDPAVLTFAFEHGQAENLANDYATGDLVTYDLKAHGEAWFDARYALRPNRGYFESKAGAANIVGASKAENKFSFAAFVEPELLDQTGTIVELAGPNGVDFALEQLGKRFVARLRTHTSDELFEIPLRQTRPGEHLLVGFAHNRAFGKVATVVYGRVNGATCLHDTSITGDLSSWSADTLRVGDGKWRGAVHHLAFFGRDRTDFETENDSTLARQWTESKPRIPRRKVRATLTAKARIQTLAELSPYQEGLSVYEYRTPRGPVRVAHWTWLSGQPTAAAAREIGADYDLELESYALHEEIAGRTLCEDGLPLVDLELLFDLK